MKVLKILFCMFFIFSLLSAENVITAYRLLGIEDRYGIKISDSYKMDQITNDFLNKPLETTNHIHDILLKCKSHSDLKSVGKNFFPNLNVKETDLIEFYKNRHNYLKQNQIVKNKMEKYYSSYLPTQTPEINYEPNMIAFEDGLNFSNKRRARVAGEELTKKIVALMDSLPSLADSEYFETVIEASSVVESFGFLNLMKKANMFFAENPKESMFKTRKKIGNEYVKIIIGSSKDNKITQSCDILIDLGGNDQYTNLYAGKNQVKMIIDLSGDDIYAGADSTIASVLGEIYVIDLEGDDYYKGKDFSVASTFGGIAAILDYEGNDSYNGNDFSVAASKKGFSMIYDVSGADKYFGGAQTQAFASMDGISWIIDEHGNDVYVASSDQEDVLRYKDNNLTMAQGFSIGERPFHKGGVAILLDANGNDTYKADVFGQGGAYWLATGILADLSGNDTYSAKQYCQGAGVHLAVGAQYDLSGSDQYTSWSVSQGCGHDLSFGVLKDDSGVDYYISNTLSLGAGNANGYGLFIDSSGNDYYMVENPSKSGGYGNVRREFGSLGIFLDESGKDYFIPSKWENLLEIKSNKGIFWDIQTENDKEKE